MQVIDDINNDFDKRLPNNRDSTGHPIGNNAYLWLIRHYERNVNVLASMWIKFYGTIK